MISALALATVTHWTVPAMGETMRLPDAIPEDGEKGGAVTIVVAKDEYEPGSFVVRSDEDLGKVRFELTAFTNAAGIALPPTQLDLKFVKVWYQNRNAWFSYFGDTGFKLCPELLVNDEDLIRVDTVNEANYARLRESDGTVREWWLNPPFQMDKRPHAEALSRRTAGFASMKPNFRDAETLQPVAVPANESKQFFLTVHATKDTPAGLYRGAVRLKRSNNQTILSIPVAVRVLDFVLPPPGTLADPERELLVASYHYLDMDHILSENGCDRALAVRQLEAILADQVAHGQTMHKLRSDRVDIEDERGEIPMTVGLMKKVGMRTDVLIGGARFSSPKRDYAAHHADAVRKRAAFDATFGHHNVFLTYGDEPKSSWFTERRHVLEAYHDAGFRFFLAGEENMFTRGAEFVGWANLARRPEAVDSVMLWSRMPDTRCAWYGLMHVGPENPAFNRRQYGFAPYLSGYSAFANYAHHLGPYNDACQRYRPMVFAYGVFGGVLDTLQWEGFREGLDDIRYATLMSRLARKAIASDVPSVTRAGRRAMRTLLQFDKARDDSAALRGELIDAILALRELVGDPVPCEAPAPVGADAEKLVARYDVARPFGFHEMAVAGRFAEAAKEVDAQLESSQAKRTFGNEAVVQSAVVAYWGTGRGAEASRLLDRILVLKPTLKPDVRTNLLFAARLAADASEEGIERSLTEFASLSARGKADALDYAGCLANWMGDEQTVRRLWKVREHFRKRPETRVMEVAYTEKEMLGPESWLRPGLVMNPQKMDRVFGDDVSFLGTDVATGRRGVTEEGAVRKTLEKPVFSSVCDDWGVHLRFVERNPQARTIAVGGVSGGSWEMYLAPSADMPHVAILCSVAPGATAEYANTQYETYGFRHLKAGQDSTRSQVVFGDDDTIETYVSISWENYANRLPGPDGEWEFEALRWGNSGSSAWNGTESIHGRSTWGRLRFRIPEEARARIARRLLAKAVSAYRREKTSEKNFEGVLAHWQDADNGDPKFYREEVAPIVGRLDAIAARVETGLSDGQTIRMSGRELEELRDVRKTVARRREIWLAKRRIGE